LQPAASAEHTPAGPSSTATHELAGTPSACAGLPLAFALRGLGKTVHLANLSFSALDLIDDWYEPNLAAIRPETTGHQDYFPERTLARWLQRSGRPCPWARESAGRLRLIPM
jgi:hypothetical protein